MLCMGLMYATKTETVFLMVLIVFRRRSKKTAKDIRGVILNNARFHPDRLKKKMKHVEAPSDDESMDEDAVTTTESR